MQSCKLRLAANYFVGLFAVYILPKCSTIILSEADLIIACKKLIKLLRLNSYFYGARLAPSCIASGQQSYCRCSNYIFVAKATLSQHVLISKVFFNYFFIIRGIGDQSFRKKMGGSYSLCPLVQCEATLYVPLCSVKQPSLFSLV